MATRNNKAAGNTYELSIAKELMLIYKNRNIISTRLGSRAKDNCAVDLMCEDELTKGELPVRVQTKTTAKTLDYMSIFKQMPRALGIINLIISKRTAKVIPSEKVLSKSPNPERAARGTFQPRGEFAIMHKEDCYELLRYKEAYNELKRFMLEHSPKPEVAIAKIDQQREEWNLS